MFEVNRELIKVVENHIEPAFEKIFRAITDIENHLGKIDTKLERLDTMQQDISTMKQGISTMQVDITELKTDLSDHKREFHDFKVEIKPRVINNEKDLYGLEKKFEELRRYWRLKSMNLDK